MTTMTKDEVRSKVREQYAEVARTGGCAPNCCGPGAKASLDWGYSEHDMGSVPDGANMGLGCGNPQAIAALQAGETVLDLGSGGGFDCFLAARQVGPEGRVVGVDMTPEMVNRARSNAEKLRLSNVEFRLGEIEHLPVPDASVDVILSNCVVNLSPDKERVFRDAFRVLKPGGRLAISDVVEMSELPQELRGDILALTGCVSGATPVAELERMLHVAGFTEVNVRVREGSGQLIERCLPASGAREYVASATIEARKPGARGCCSPTCCGPESA